MTAEQKSYRNIFLTLNNYNQAELNDIWFYKTTYKVLGMEVGHKCGTPHIHAYLEFKNSVNFTTMKKMWPRCRIESRKGTAKDAADYCKKEGLFWEEGEISKQGARVDLTRIGEQLRTGIKLVDIANQDENFGSVIRYNRGFTWYQNELLSDRNCRPTVHWHYGVTDCGKTYNAKEIVNHEIDKFYIKDSTKWWDGYKQQPLIIIDDFDGKWPYRDLLRLLDENPYQGQLKGGYVKINSPDIVITCEHHPEFFWGPGGKDFEHATENSLNQVLRRIAKIKFFFNDGNGRCVRVILDRTQK